jgi:hypothetical protein
MNETETVVDTPVVSPDLSITKTERFDNNRLLQLLANLSLPSTEKTKLRGLKNGAHNFCYYTTSYKYGNTSKIEHLGRFYVCKGIGAQSLTRDVRNALYGEYYWDIDMVNAQPTLLMQYCKANGWAHESVKHYVENRDTILQDVCNKLNCDRDTAKQRASAVMFGGSSDGLTDFFKLYAEELKTIRQNVWNANKSRFRHLNTKPNFLNSCFATVLQTEENKCLMAMDKSLAKQGRSMDALIFDGGLVAKKENEKELDESILRQTEADVLASTGYTVQLLVKPMNTTITFTEATDDYAVMKAEFEKTYFSLQNPQCFGWIDNDEIKLLKREGLVHLEGAKKMANGKPFLPIWIDDNEKLTYNRLVFSPKKEIPDDCLNLFVKYENEPKEGDYSAYSELMDLVCSHDKPAIEYLENVFAHMIQKPYIKTGVCICIQGEEGVGKDMLLDGVGKMFGRKHYFKTDSPENDIFHTFNTGTESCIMVKFEESAFKTNKANQAKLKGLITSELATYRRKGYDTITLDDYRNFFMSTNEFMPFVLDDTDRRFVLFRASSERIGQSDWWKEMFDKINDQRSAYHHYLLNKDISNFNPRRDRVLTQAYLDIKSLTATPYHANFLQKVICELLEDAKDDDVIIKTWKGSQLVDDMGKFMGDKFKMNPTRMGIDMRVYQDHGFDKKKTKYSNSYVLYPVLCMEFLKTKGWWCE